MLVQVKSESCPSQVLDTKLSALHGICSPCKQDPLCLVSVLVEDVDVVSG